MTERDLYRMRLWRWTFEHAVLERHIFRSAIDLANRSVEAFDLMFPASPAQIPQVEDGTAE